MALVQGEKTCTAALRKPEPTQADSLVVGALRGKRIRIMQAAQTRHRSRTIIDEEQLKSDLPPSRNPVTCRYFRYTRFNPKENPS